MFVLIVLILVLMVLHVLCLRGRKGQPGMEVLRSWYYAHRGLHDAEKPENSMAAYKAALDKGYGIEFDVHLLKDGTLAVMHDSDQKRTTGQEGFIEDLTAEDLCKYHLGGTDQVIPAFQEVLDLFDGQAPLIIELKTRNGNADALTEAVCRVLKNYVGPYCVESFDPRCIRYLRRHYPQIIRGQLAEDAVKRDKSLSWPVRFMCSYYLENFLTVPDFIAYRFEDRETASNAICRRVWGIQGVSWTIRTPEDFKTAVREGWIPIFENFDPKALGLDKQLEKQN